jgi:hypothetical protein
VPGVWTLFQRGHLTCREGACRREPSGNRWVGVFRLMLSDIATAAGRQKKKPAHEGAG